MHAADGQLLLGLAVDVDWSARAWEVWHLGNFSRQEVSKETRWPDNPDVMMTL